MDVNLDALRHFLVGSWSDSHDKTGQPCSSLNSAWPSPPTLRDGVYRTHWALFCLPKKEGNIPQSFFLFVVIVYRYYI